jgi:hypothetical protein
MYGIAVLAQVVMQRILVAFQDSQLHTLVCPQTIEGIKEFVGHWLVSANIRSRVDHLGVALHEIISSGSRNWV